MSLLITSDVPPVMSLGIQRTLLSELIVIFTALLSNVAWLMSVGLHFKFQLLAINTKSSLNCMIVLCFQLHLIFKYCLNYGCGIEGISWYFIE